MTYIWLKYDLYMTSPSETSRLSDNIHHGYNVHCLFTAFRALHKQISSTEWDAHFKPPSPAVSRAALPGMKSSSTHGSNRIGPVVHLSGGLSSSTLAWMHLLSPFLLHSPLWKILNSVIKKTKNTSVQVCKCHTEGVKYRERILSLCESLQPSGFKCFIIM